MSRVPTPSDAAVREVPKFLLKLWNMVDDAQTKEFITWSPDGHSFLIINQARVVELLPFYFRHNNFASFVRQLNLYGFRKIGDSGGNGGALSQVFGTQTLQFEHSDFIRDDPDRLLKIRRKTGSDKSQLHEIDVESINSSQTQYRSRTTKNNNQDTQEILSILVSEISTLKSRADLSADQITNLQMENEKLQKELSDLQLKQLRMLERQTKHELFTKQIFEFIFNRNCPNRKRKFEKTFGTTISNIFETVGGHDYTGDDLNLGSQQLQNGVNSPPPGVIISEIEPDLVQRSSPGLVPNERNALVPFTRVQQGDLYAQASSEQTRDSWIRLLNTSRGHVVGNEVVLANNRNASDHFTITQPNSSNTVFQNGSSSFHQGTSNSFPTHSSTLQGLESSPSKVPKLCHESSGSVPFQSPVHVQTSSPHTIIQTTPDPSFNTLQINPPSSPADSLRRLISWEATNSEHIENPGPLSPGLEDLFQDIPDQGQVGIGSPGTFNEMWDQISKEGDDSLDCLMLPELLPTDEEDET